MPILVPGHNERRLQQGFSLLEVLVVLAIIGIVTGTASLGIRAAQDSHSLHTDAQRLARLFGLAQAEARKTGRPVIWEYNNTGYRFTQAPQHLLLPAALAERMASLNTTGFTPSSALRARAWDTSQPVSVQIDPSATQVFHGEWISGPREVKLDNGLATVRLTRTGNGQYRVLP